MAKVNIKDLDKAEVFKALYDNSQPIGMGWLHFVPGELSLKEAKDVVKRYTYIDYYRGRVIKIKLEGDELDTYLYDRDNGQGAAEQAIQPLFNKPKAESPSLWQRWKKWF